MTHAASMRRSRVGVSEKSFLLERSAWHAPGIAQAIVVQV